MKKVTFGAVLIGLMAPLSLAQVPLGNQVSGSPGQATARAWQGGEREAAMRLLSSPARAEQAGGRRYQDPAQATEPRVRISDLHPVEQENLRRTALETEIRAAEAEQRLATESANALATLQEREDERLRRLREENRHELQLANQLALDLQNQQVALHHAAMDLHQRAISAQDQLTHNRAHEDQRRRDIVNDRWRRSRENIGNAFGELSPIVAAVVNRVSHGDEDHVDPHRQRLFDAEQAGMTADTTRLRAEHREILGESRELFRLRMELLTRRLQAVDSERQQLRLPLPQQ